MLIKSTAGSGHAPRRGELTNKRISGIVGPKTATLGFGRSPFGPNRPNPAPSPPHPHPSPTNREYYAVVKPNPPRGAKGLRRGGDISEEVVDTALTTGTAACRQASRPATTRAHVHTRRRPFYSCTPPPLNPHPLPGRRRAALVCRIFATAAHYYGARLAHGCRPGTVTAVCRRSEWAPGKQRPSMARLRPFLHLARGTVFAHERHVLSVSAHYSRAVSYCRPISRCAVSRRSWR